MVLNDLIDKTNDQDGSQIVGITVNSKQPLRLSDRCFHLGEMFDGFWRHAEHYSKKR